VSNSAEFPQGQRQFPQITCKPGKGGHNSRILDNKNRILTEPCNFDKAIVVCPDIYIAFRRYRAQHSMFVAMAWGEPLTPPYQDRPDNLYLMRTVDCRDNVPYPLRGNLQRILYRRGAWEERYPKVGSDIVQELRGLTYFLETLHTEYLAPDTTRLPTFPEMTTLHLSGFDVQDYRPELKSRERAHYLEGIYENYDMFYKVKFVCLFGYLEAHCHSK
jgi:hypothetical protein